MTKQELHELASWGVRRKLQEMERQLASMHAEFPEAFLSDTPPLLLKAEEREGRPPDAMTGRIGHGTAMQKILDALQGGPPQRYKDIRRATGVRGGSLSGALNRLKGRGLVVRHGNLWSLPGASSTSPEPVGQPIARKKASGRPAKATHYGKAAAGPARKFWKERWYQRLQAHGPEGLAASAAALGTVSPMLTSTSQGWQKAGIIVKVEPGVYAVGKKKPDPALLQRAAEAMASQNGGGA